MTMLTRIDQFLRDSEMTPTRFGRLVANDPRLVLDMRNGRQVRGPMAARVAAFLDRHAS